MSQLQNQILFIRQVLLIGFASTWVHSLFRDALNVNIFPFMYVYVFVSCAEAESCVNFGRPSRTTGTSPPEALSGGSRSEKPGHLSILLNTSVFIFRTRARVCSFPPTLKPISVGQVLWSFWKCHFVKCHYSVDPPYGHDRHVTTTSTWSFICKLTTVVPVSTRWNVYISRDWLFAWDTKILRERFSVWLIYSFDHVLLWVLHPVYFLLLFFFNYAKLKDVNACHSCFLHFFRLI